MKKFYLLTKTLLVAALLMVGASNAWGETVQVLSENYESFSADADIKSALESVGWTFTGKDSNNPTAYCNQGTAVNTSKYANLYYPLGGASRQQYWNFASSVTSALTDDNWTLTFSAAMTPGNNQTGSGIGISGTKSSFSATAQGITNPFFSMYNSAANGTTYTAVIGSTTLDGTYTLTSGTWYKFTISATNITNSTATIYVKVTSYDGATTVLESTQTDISTSSIGTLKGIVWGSAKYNPRLLLDDVLLTKESDAEIANYTVKYVSTIADVETEIKSSVVREGEVDATVSLDASDKNTITYGGHQYYYVSDNASSSTIKDDNSTVVKVVFAQATFDNGNYYFKNKANGAYFAAGNSWSTHAITNAIGHGVSLSVQSGGSYYLDTQISNGGASHYLNGEWTDGAAQGWTIASDGAGYYTINNGSGNLTAGAVGGDLTVGASTDDAAKWTVMTAAAWKAENVARLDAATASNGVDATFYIPAANFNRNDNTENAKWQGSPTLFGSNTNYNAEKRNTNFDVYQTLTGLKPGAYKLTVQGFYRNGDAVDADPTVCNAILYANSTEKALVNVVSEGKAEADADHGFTTLKSGKHVPDGQEDASKTFDNNYYNNELFFVVDEDGALRVGVKKSTAVTNDWTVFDNFKLTYYGTSVSGTITPAGWCSFASSYPLDLSKISGGTVYYASAADGSTITLTSTGDVTVPAGEGLMIKGTPNAEFTINVAASGTSISGNKLIGQTTTGNVTASGTDGKYHYVFGYESSSVYGFYNLTEDTSVSAGKAYLETTTALSAGLGARAIGFVVDDDILTGIEQIENGEVKSSLPVKRIVNGKLVIEKKGMMFNAAGAKLY